MRWDFGERPDPDGAIAQDLIRDKLVTKGELATFAKRAIPHGGTKSGPPPPSIFSLGTLQICFRCTCSKPTLSSMNMAR